MQDDTSLEPVPTPEELEQMQQAADDAEFARRVRREVKRIESGDADDDLAQDEVEDSQEREAKQEAEQERVAAEEAERKREERKQHSIFWQLISGSILLRQGVSKYYTQMMLVAVMFFVSIFVMFWSLHLDMRYSDLSRQNQLMREKSIRLQEMRHSKCSHSAISAELKRREIDLGDATRPATVINEEW